MLVPSFTFENSVQNEDRSVGESKEGLPGAGGGATKKLRRTVLVTWRERVSERKQELERDFAERVDILDKAKQDDLREREEVE